MLKSLTRGISALVRPGAANREVDDEIADYVEQATREYIVRGLSPADARRAALTDVGSAAAAREEVRSSGWEHAFETFIADVRYALRRLRNQPGFTAVAAITLALGIGASTAIFSAVNPILFAPLPYPNGSRLMMIWDTYHGERADVTFHTFREVAARAHSFESLAATDPWMPVRTSAAEPERLSGQLVSAGFFHVLGVSPKIGRDFDPSDDVVNGPAVVILSDALWQRRFGGDRTLLGRQIVLDGDPYTVIGVMPPGFENVLLPAAELWTTLRYDSTHITNLQTGEWGHHMKLIGRLAPGANLEAARRELAAISQNQIPEFPRAPWASLRNGFIVNSLQGEVARGVKPALLAVLGAVLLLLAIAAVNVTNLLLARGAQRRGEFAMRIALGAARGRLVRQLLTESLLLALLGGGLGLAIARAGIDALIALSPPGLPRTAAIALDPSVFLFALGLTVFVGLVVGLMPALEASRHHVSGRLAETSQRTLGGGRKTRRMLVVIEVALALVLLVSAGLLLNSLRRVFSIGPGFDPANLLTMQVQISGHAVQSIDAHQRLYEQALERVRAIPGVSSAAFTSLLPLSGDPNDTYGASFEDQESYDAFRYVVTPDYFATMRIALRAGRLLNERDTKGAPQVVVISETLANRHFKGQNPIGQRMHVGPSARPWYTIVGVVADVKQSSLALRAPEAMYITTTQSWFGDEAVSLVARTRGDAASLAPLVKNAIWAVDKDQPIIRVALMSALVERSEAERRFILILFEAFAMVALVLAAIGIYGVQSGSVGERTREIGVRAALGASRGNILGFFVREGLALTAAGMLIGLAGAAGATRALATLLFGISHLDATTYATVTAVLATVSVIACWAPAWRASRVDPAVTLRSE